MPYIRFFSLIIEWDYFFFPFIMINLKNLCIWSIFYFTILKLQSLLISLSTNTLALFSIEYKHWTTINTRHNNQKRRERLHHCKIGAFHQLLRNSSFWLTANTVFSTLLVLQIACISQRHVGSGILSLASFRTPAAQT